jgi:uncharacterized protein YjbI with pentapeptide repeats
MPDQALIADLPRRLDLHAKWRRMEKGGERLVLIGADLRDANLRHANLCGAELRVADLRDANLIGADLRDADLRGTCVDLLLKDDGRGYQVVAHRGLTSDGEALYLAGCRQLTVTGARKHWGNPNHPHPQAAARILAAIEAHQNTL